MRRSYHQRKRLKKRAPGGAKNVGPPRKPRHFKIRPGADAGLKKVFARIGTPPQSAFKPDPFQLRAVEAIAASDCLVTAPTGAGKTWIAEQAIARVLQEGGRAWYASPLKALSNTIYQRFSRLFGSHQVGILTGDRKENADAAVIVGTTEILRNHLYDAMQEGIDIPTDLVVMDEAHFLGDADRGVVWEEIMIYLPRRIPLLMLSATIGNAHEIAAWLHSIRHRDCRVVAAGNRPVPLFPLFLHPGGTLAPLLANSGKKRLHGRLRQYLKLKRPPLLAPPAVLPPFGPIMRVLRKYRLLPVIFFMKSRKDCDRALERCRDLDLPAGTDPSDHHDRIDTLTRKHAHLSGHKQLASLKHNAVAAHHSGQLPAWKLLVETLMTEGRLNAVFATSTVAAGVNFPARTVAFQHSDRFNGHEFLPLNATEFHQMTGRAGRRSMDKIGFALLLPGKYMDLRLCARLVSAPAAAVTSQIKIDFGMVLNLLLSHSPDQIENLLAQSFAAFLLAVRKKQARRRSHLKQAPQLLAEDFRRHLSFLQHSGYVEGDGCLTIDGRWASKLRVDQPLLIAEAFRRDLLPKADPALLAAMVASFVDERELEEGRGWQAAPTVLKNAFRSVQRGMQPFMRALAKHGFRTKNLHISPSLTLWAWAQDYPWSLLCRASGMEEGDLAGLILRCADNLRHIRALADVFPTAAETARQAVDLIVREPVAGIYDL